MNDLKTAKTATPARRNLNVESAVDQLESSFASLRLSINDLDDTMKPLLADENQALAEVDDNRCRSTGESAVAERILVIADEIRDRGIRIKNLTDRL